MIDCIDVWIIVLYVVVLEIFVDNGICYDLVCDFIVFVCVVV